MSSSLLAVFVCLAAASSVVYAVTCPDDACGIVARRDPNSLAGLLSDPVFCTCTCDDEGNTLFHASVPSICQGCIEELVGAGCDVDVRDNGGNTALHDAAEQCINPVTTTLLTQGANRAATNNAGNTPVCVVGAGSPPNPSECGTVARNIIGANPSNVNPPPENCFLDTQTFQFCPCNLCAGGILPYEAVARGVADVIGQDCGSPALCNADVPPC